MKKLSFSRILSLIVSVSIFGVSLGALAAVTLYRGVDVTKSTGRAKLYSANAFRFNTELSTFNSISAAVSAPNGRLSPCYLTFSVSAPNVVNASGPVSGLPGYFATFDNTDPGHWSISQPGVASTVAANDIVAYASAVRPVVNGAQSNPACN